MAEQTWLIGPGDSGNREAAATTRQQQQLRIKYGLAATAGRRRGDRKKSVTEMAATHIWIFGRGCGKKAETDVTTRWQSKLGLAVASATAMAAARKKQKKQCELGLQDVVAVTTEMWQQHIAKI